MANPRGYGPPPGIYVPFTPAAPTQPDPGEEDRAHLKLLGTLTLVYGVFLALASVFAFFYILICAAAALDLDDSDSVWVGGFVAIVGVVVCGLLLLKAIILFFSGIGLSNHKWQTLSYIGAVLSCMNVPLGMVLAVFTFLVLGRPSVRALYAGRPVIAPQAPPIPTSPRTDSPPRWKPEKTPPRTRVVPLVRVATPT